MASYENFYPGADYGLDPNYGSFTGYRVRSSEIGYAVDATTANQLKRSSDKMNTGATTIEVQGINIVGGGGPMKVMDSIPKQHFKEINRLKKLAGVNLTFHGPLVEPTGIGRGQWSELDREHAETELKSAVERAHDLDPDGNIIVTIHSSVGLPEPETKIKNKDGKEISRAISVIDERSGRFGQLPAPQPDYFTGREVSPKDQLREVNETAWFNALSNINIGVQRAEDTLLKFRIEEDKSLKPILGAYKEIKENPSKQGKIIDILHQELGKEQAGLSKAYLSNIINSLNYAEINAKDAYVRLQQEFNTAYDAIKDSNKDRDREALRKLKKYRDEVASNLESWEKDPSKISDFTDTIAQGVRLLNSINPPETLKPIREFAIDKASDTFSGVALASFKKFKNTAPIISIENPPAGSGLAKGDELRDLVKESRKKFIKRAQEEVGLSESEAKEQAEKLIGVTWDVGHINMLRKYGYKKKDLVNETKQIAPFIKHIHLSDNFGIEHTELPMGMGNVPTKEHLELLEKYNKKIKKIVETGDWFSRTGLGLTRTPILETSEAFGSPLYMIEEAPYWNQIKSIYGSYPSDLGPINPEVHHSIYGSRFTTLPAELGGQVAGQNRLSGTPSE